MMAAIARPAVLAQRHTSSFFDRLLPFLSHQDDVFHWNGLCGTSPSPGTQVERGGCPPAGLQCKGGSQCRRAGVGERAGGSSEGAQAVRQNFGSAGVGVWQGLVAVSAQYAQG